MKEENIELQMDIIRMYTYYVISYFNGPNVTLNIMTRIMELTLKNGIDDWGRKLDKSLKPTHPSITIHNEILDKYGREEYIENIKGAINVVKNFNSTNGKNRYTLSSIYSDECIDTLAEYMMMCILKISDLLFTLENEKDKMEEEGKTLARFIIGYKYYEGAEGPKDCERAVKEWKKIQDKFPLARYKVANSYYYGDGVQKNYEKAFKLYSSVNKIEQARYMLGIMYYNGYGVKKNYEKAYQELSGFSDYSYYIKIRADYYVGMMLLYGKGTEMDKEKAMELLDGHYKSGLFELKYDSLKKMFKQYYIGNAEDKKEVNDEEKSE